MPKDKNIVLLDGVIGDDVKLKKTKEGKEFYTFSLCIRTYDKEFADSTERNHSQSFIRIFVYDKKQIEYLRKMRIHQGLRASIFGRLCSFMSERKGISFLANNVICRDIEIIRTKPDATVDNDYEEPTLEEEETDGTDE